MYGNFGFSNIELLLVQFILCWLIRPRFGNFVFLVALVNHLFLSFAFIFKLWERDICHVVLPEISVGCRYIIMVCACRHFVIARNTSFAAFTTAFGGRLSRFVKIQFDDAGIITARLLKINTILSRVLCDVTIFLPCH